VDRLVEHADNPRVHPPAQIKALARAIEKFGFTVPILIDSHRVVMAGHGRLAAAKQWGMARMSVIAVTHLNAKQRKAYMILDNQIALGAKWDESKLEDIVDELQRGAPDLIPLLGFDDSYIARLLGKPMGDITEPALSPA